MVPANPRSPSVTPPAASVSTTTSSRTRTQTILKIPMNRRSKAAVWLWTTSTTMATSSSTSLRAALRRADFLPLLMADLSSCQETKALHRRKWNGPAISSTWTLTVGRTSCRFSMSRSRCLGMTGLGVSSRRLRLQESPISALPTRWPAADYDLDGDLDLFFAHWGGIVDRSALTEYLWQNDGTGRFTDVSDRVAITSSGGIRRFRH